MDEVIDAAEGNGDSFNALALRLCGRQNSITLPPLVRGSGLEGKDGSISAATLFVDAIRCASTAKALGDISTRGTITQLSAIVQQPNWTGTADLAPMQAALARETMVGARLPLASLNGRVFNKAATILVPRTIPLQHGSVLLVPFTLWSPAAAAAINTLALSAPHQIIYAITSWSANTGQKDVTSDAVLSALRTLRQNLPPQASIVIVPDTQLRAFNADTFPAGIVISSGIVRSNSPLSGKGAEQLLLRTLRGIAETR